MKIDNFLVSEINLFAFLKLLFLCIRNDKKKSIFFLENSRFHKIYVFCLKLLLKKVEISPIECGLGDFVDDNGHNLNYFKDDTLIELSKYFSEKLDVDILQREIEKYYPLVEIKKFTDRYIVSEMTGSVAAYCLLLGYAKKYLSSDQNTILIQKTIFFEKLSEIFSKSLKVVEVFDFRIISSLSGIARFLLFYFKQYKTHQKKEAFLEEGQNTRVAVQYIKRDPDPNRPNNFEWLEGCKIDPTNFVYYTFSQDFDERMIDFCKSKGIKLVDIKKWLFLRKKTIRVFLFAVLKSVIRLFFSNVLRNIFHRLWLSRNILRFCQLEQFWRYFFIAYNIRAHIHVGDTNEYLVPQIYALESLGGVDLSFEFSTTGFHSPMDARPLDQHAYAMWGLSELALIQNCHDRIEPKAPNVAFITGGLYQYLSAMTEKELDNKLKYFNNKNISFCIGIFDVVWRRYKVSSEKAFLLFYETVFEILKNFPQVAILIKPQDELGDEVEKKIITKGLKDRVLVLDKKLYPWSVFPKLDLAIGMSAYSTAMSEACITEIPFVCFDTANWKRHPIYERAPKDLLVDKGQDLAHVIEKHLKGQGLSKKDQAYIDYANWVDPFRDKKGHIRFGYLIMLWKQEIDKHGSAFKAMPYVVHRYTSAFGSESVVKRNWIYDNI